MPVEVLGGRSPPRREFHRHPLDTANQIRRHPLHSAGQFNIRHPLDYIGKHQAHLQPGQMGAQAEMGAVAEANVVIGPAGDIEPVWILTTSSSRLADTFQTTTQSPLRIPAAAQFGVARRHPHQLDDRAGPTDDLLDRAAHQRAVLAQQPHLAGIRV